MAPWIIYPLAYLIYYLIGSLNISTLSREIDPNILFPIVYIGLLGFWVGVILARLLPLTKKHANTIKNFNIRKALGVIIPFYLVGLSSLLLIVWKYGIPLLGGVNEEGLLTRASVSSALEHISRLIWIASAIYFIIVYYNLRRFTKYSILLIIFAALFILLLGYRSLLVILVLFVTIALFQIRRPSLLVLFSIMVSVFIITYFIWVVRYSLEGALDIKTIAATYNFPIENSFLFYPYMILRNGVSLTNKIISFVANGNLLMGKLFFADLVTILPGQQQSGGMLMAQMFGGSGVAGLTVTIVGGLYADFGIWGVGGGLFIIGLLTMIAYRKMQLSRSVYAIILYSIIMTESIHFLHRGVFSTHYIWDVVVVYFICKITAFFLKPNHKL